MNLYEISEKYQAALAGDPETGEIDQAALDAINDKLEDKADNYAKFITNLNGDIEAIDTEIDRLQKRKKTMQNKVTALKQNLQYNMEKTGKTKFKTDLFSFTLATAGKAPICLFDDVPVTKKYCKVTYKPDAEMIRTALDSGKKLKFAYYGEKKKSLRIR